MLEQVQPQEALKHEAQRNTNLTIHCQILDARHVAHMNVESDLFWCRQRIMKAKLVASPVMSYEFKFLSIDCIGVMNIAPIGSCYLNQNEPHRSLSILKIILKRRQLHRSILQWNHGIHILNLCLQKNIKDYCR